MELKLIDMKNGKMEPRISILAYGPAGSGKTTLCATAPKPILAIIVGGEENVALASLYGKDLQTTIVKTWTELQNVHKEIRSGSLAGKFKTICIDGLTELARVAENHLLEKYTLTKLRIQDFGELQDMLGKIVRAFNECGINTIYTALQLAEKDEATGAYMVKPDILGKFRDHIAALVNVCVRMGRMKNKIACSTMGGETKSYSDSVGKPRPELEAIEEPNIQVWYDKMFSVKSDQDIQPEVKFISDSQKKEILTLAQTHKVPTDKIKKHLLETYGITSSSAIKADDVNKILAWIIEAGRV